MGKEPENITARQRLRAGFLHQMLDRVAMWDTYWGETLARWHDEGLPRDVDLSEFFGLDRISGHSCDCTYRLPGKVIEETDRYVVSLNGMGMVQKTLKGIAGAPLLLDYLIKSKEDWERSKPLVHVSTAAERVSLDQLETNKVVTERGDFVAISLPDPIWSLFHSCSLKEGLVIMLQDPDWAHEVMETFTELMVACMSEMVKAGFHIDGMMVYGDIDFLHGAILFGTVNSYLDRIVFWRHFIV